MMGVWIWLACADDDKGRVPVGTESGADSVTESVATDSGPTDSGPTDSGPTDSGTDSDDSDTPPLDAPVVYWGDLHSHSNLSQDGCEDPEDQCVWDGASPGAEAFGRAAALGLAFVALTEHSEYDLWVDRSTGEARNIWDETLRLVHNGEETGVLAIVGYEWASEPSDTYGGSHRTVLFEDTQPCGQYRVSGGRADSQPKFELGREEYVNGGGVRGEDPQLLMLALEEAPTLPNCEDTRILSYFHHPAFTPPQSTDWADPINNVGDVVVEMLSEHGSSECADPTMPGCDWFQREGYVPSGSVQTALQQGYKLGFVGGTDNHEASPGSVADGPGPIAHLTDENGDGVLEARTQDFSGGLTGVWSDGPLTRAGLFDSIFARNSLASSWPFERVLIRAVAGDGTIYLPGDDVPAGAYTLEIAVPTYSYTAELVDPYGQVSEAEELVIAAGEARYVRVRADIDGAEHRLFASPFFGI